MDALIAAAARALASGDALGALKRVALREDPPALALRGIAMAQLGEHPRARELLRRAAQGFGEHEALARARCVVAEAEVALAMRDLGGAQQAALALAAATATLVAGGDVANAQQARLISARRLLLLGRIEEAQGMLAVLNGQGLPPALAAVADLVRAEAALRRLSMGAAHVALARAHEAATRAGVPALLGEVAEARAALLRPAARQRTARGDRVLRLDEVAALMASDVLVLDACRHGWRVGEDWRSLASRPVLFALAQALALAWPGDVDRLALIAQTFRTRHPDETHRARLRVEMSRLRAVVAGLADIEATPRGFALRPHDQRAVVVLAPPFEGDEASLLALLADGAAWSTSALALALGASQRTVQRALVGLQASGQVRAIGQARARRWLSAPLAGFATSLLLPAALSPG